MVVKFFSNKKGGSVKALDYLLNEREKDGTARVLSGDEQLTRNIINSFWENKFNITIIDLDKDMTDLAKTNEILLNLNQKSFLNKNVSVINMDAFKYLSDTKNKKFDFIIADFTDPRDVWVAKLYSKEFYLMIKSKLNDNWIFVTQSWNAFFAKESFWCINKMYKLSRLCSKFS